MSEKEKFSPRVEQVREGLTLHSGGKEIPFSIWKIPTSDSIKDRLAKLNMVGNFDINEFRQVHREDIDRIHAELATKNVVYDTKGESSLSIRVANLGSINDPKKHVICLLTPWSTTGDMENIQLDIEAVALMYPENRIIHITTPGTDNESTPLLTDGALREMVDTGSFAHMAKQMADVLENNPEFCDIEKIIGLSEGGSISPAFAAELNQRKIAHVKEVFTFDAPGIKHEKLAKFAFKFMAVEGLMPFVGHLARIKDSSPDMQMAEAHTRDAKKYKIKKGHDLWPRAKTLAEGGTAQDIERAINSGVHIVEFSAGSSSITDTQAAVNLTDRFPRRYEVVEMPRAGHGSYEINPFSIPLFVQAVEGFNP